MDLLSRLIRRSTWKWLYIGLGIKRWLLLLFFGVAILALGLDYILINVYRDVPLPDIFYYLTLQFIDRWVRGLLFGIVGIAMIAIAMTKLGESLVSAFATQDTDLVELLYRKRLRKRGPKVVAIGGGTGLSTLLRGLKDRTDNLTAIVTVADDGGSSGKLRRDLGMLPPGDIRQCIAALADSEPLMGSLLQYRFGEGSGLEGHSFGNLLIAAMAGITGSFERGLLESSRVLAVRGKIFPSTLQNVTLCAETRHPEQTNTPLQRVAGESSITHHGRPIERVYLEPEHVSAYPGVVRAILEADLVIAGPGSLYTSVLPNLIVDEIRGALQVSQAAKVYVCNVATQPGETDDFTVQDHFDALEQHVGKGIFSTVVANNNWAYTFPEHTHSTMVRVRESESPPYDMLLNNLVDESMPWRHDPGKLTRVIFDWYTASKKK